jgi:hypothetical protein
MKRLTQEEFIQRATEVHNGKYDYSKVNYVNNTTKVCIICPKHGEFWQIPKTHKKGVGCPQCAIDKTKSNTNAFIQKAKEIWGDVFSFEKTIYLKSSDNIIVTCKKHGDWVTTPNRILNGHGCPKCKAINHRRNIYGVGVVLTSAFVANNKSYKVWVDMLRRCYNKSFGKSYKDCCVCDEWLIYDNFKKWYDERYFDGCVLDKDWLKMWNNVYSPSTCCLIPQELNLLIVKRKGKNNGLPIGVQYDNKTKKYYPTIRFRNSNVVKILGYNTPNEAFEVYKKSKEKWIKKVVSKYKNLLEPHVYDAIYNYKVEEYKFNV